MSITSYTFAIGTDPEVMCVSNGNPVSPIGLIGGTKKNPMRTTHGWVQEDNVALEGNIEPCYDRQAWVTTISNLLSDFDEILKPLDMQVSIKASQLFPDDQLLHPLAKLAGCEPDFNAWGLCPNEKPDLSSSNLRVFGGHIHISSDLFKDPMDRIYFTRVMDLCAGIPSVLMDKDLDRKKLYGKAGCHRPKFTARGDTFDGVEYRTLSNFWLGNTNLMGWAYDVVDMAVKRYDELKSNIPVVVESVINTNDRLTAEKLVKDYELLVV